MINKRDQSPGSGKADAAPEEEALIASRLKNSSDRPPINAGWMGKNDSRPAGGLVSANELISLSALIAYVAHKTGASEFRIERELADRFNVANIKCLPLPSFDAAIRFLAERVR